MEAAYGSAMFASLTRTDPATTAPTNDDLLPALRQAARQRQRGDLRRARQLLQRIAFDARDNACLWTRYALCCAATGRFDDARRAFSQAVWLHERTGRRRGAEVTARLAQLSLSGILPRNYCLAAPR